ncbi:MAG: DUF1326 domain-containing protein [Thermoanaerobaculia bacterium]
MRTARLTLAALFLLSSVPARAGDEKNTSWKASGVLEEACSCDAACPCWFDSKPTRSHCSGGQVIFIEKGSYGDIPLDGLAIGTMGQSPDGTTMMESMGKWDFINIYIDEKGNREQRQALEAIAKATVPLGAPPEKTRIQYVAITRKTEGSEHTITIGSVASFSGHLIPGGSGGSPRIVNAPGADPIHREYQQGRTTRQTYTDSGQKWDWSNTNYMYATFQTDSDEYEKFSAAMAQAMQKAKTEKKTN